MSLSDEDRAAGWVEWAGGECPVPAGTPVEFRNRGGGSDTVENSFNLIWNWYGKSAAWHIIAYRVADQRAAAALATTGETGGVAEAAISPSCLTDNVAKPANPSQDLQTAAHPSATPQRFGYWQNMVSLSAYEALEREAAALRRERDDLKHDIARYVEMNACLVGDTFAAEQRANSAEAALKATAAYRFDRDLKKAESERDAKDQQLASCYDRMNKAELERDALQRRLDAPVKEGLIAGLPVFDKNRDRFTVPMMCAAMAQAANCIRDLHRRLVEAQEKLVEVSKNYSEEITRQQNRAEAAEQRLDAVYVESNDLRIRAALLNNELVATEQERDEAVRKEREACAVLCTKLATAGRAAEGGKNG